MSMDSSAPLNQRQLLEQAIVTIRDLNTKLEVSSRATRSPIAIVGIGCRFPGQSDSPEAFWENLSRGFDAVGEVPGERWDVERYFASDPDVPGKTVSRWGSFLSGVENFDAPLFGMSPREAIQTDPQQRLLLEVTWEALERAGYNPRGLSGSATGVYVGITTNDYASLLDAGDYLACDAHSLAGNSLNFAAGRIAYVLGLQGPCMAVDTACSSSLVAVHLACQSLRTGESALALAAGVNLMFDPKGHIVTSKARMLSATGRCRTFDAGADGIVRGEGCAVLVLKRLEDAERAGDPIVAVIRGSAVNQDGPSSGITVPNGSAQTAVVRRALRDAGVEPSDVDYVEAHGTGTPLGDPIEIHALGEALELSKRRGRPLRVGSVKTNLGHLESASGIAGLVKAALVVQHGAVPPHLHLRERSPRIDWSRAPVEIPTQLEPLEGAGSAKVIAGVSAFGGSGTNAHVVLERWSGRSRHTRAAATAGSAKLELGASAAGVPDRSEDEPRILTLSAHSESSLRALAARYADTLETFDGRFSDVCFTAAAARARLRHRLAVVASGASEAREGLAAFATGSSSRHTFYEVAPASGEPRVAFLFTGQGSLYGGVARDLLDDEGAFADAIERCAAILDPLLGRSLVQLLRDPAAADLLDTRFAQPALAALEYALVKQWAEWGVEPHAVLGHSVGEFAAATAAGAIELEPMLRLVAERAKLMADLPRDGEMMAVLASAEEVSAVLAEVGDELSVAAFNGPRNTVVSGLRTAMRAARDRFVARGMQCKPLETSHAFHSACMDPILPALGRAASRTGSRALNVSFVAGATAATLQAGDLIDPQYWGAQARQPVQFERALAALLETGCTALVEIGPAPVLLGMAKSCGDVSALPALPSLRSGVSGRIQMRYSLARLYCAGAPVTPAALHSARNPRRVSLPTYCFQRSRFWPSALPPKATKSEDLVGAVDASAAPSRHRFDVDLGTRQFPWLVDHRVHGEVVVPGAFHLARILAALARCRPDQGYSIQNVGFVQPLVLNGAVERRCSLELTHGEDGTSFEVRSSMLRAGSADPTDPSIEVHATGSCRRGDLGSSAAPDLSEARASCAETCGLEDLTSGLRGVGIELGPSFQWVEAIARGRGQVVARLRAPRAEFERPTDTLPVGQLDACLQLIAMALSAEEHGNRAFVPVAIEELWLARSHHGALTVHLRMRPRERAGALLTADIWATDDEGREVLRVRGLAIREADRAALLRAVARRAASDDLDVVKWTPLPALSAQAPSLAGRHVLALGDVDSALTQQLEEAVRLRGGSLQRLTSLAELKAHGAPASDVMYLWPEDPPGAVAWGAVAMRLEELARMATSLGALDPTLRPWIVTRGGQALPGHLPDAGAAAAWGFGRCWLSEQPMSKLTLLDIDPAESAHGTGGALIADELGSSDELQVLYCSGVRYGARLTIARSEHTTAIPSSESYVLGTAARGVLDNLQWQPAEPLPALGAHDVELVTEVAGLNFRDVLNALDLYPGDAGGFGGECVGRVARTGAQVTGVGVGDRVLCFFARSGCLRSRVVCDEQFVFPAPQALTPSEAATIPIAFLTAHYALHVLAKLRRGERILIHSGAGGVGMAAIQLALAVGAEVYATAGSEAKRRRLEQIGVRHVMDSRKPRFVEALEEHQPGLRMDVVLNSLSGDFVRESLDALAIGGRFLEMGKVDVWSTERAQQYRPDVEHQAFDLLEVAAREPHSLRAMVSELLERFAREELQPLPRTVFAVTEVAAAFRHMAQARHVGKVVVRFPGAADDSALVREHGTYVVLGGLGALGLSTADWLVARGAKRIALVGRTAPTDERVRRVQQMRDLGADVTVHELDASSLKALHGLLAQLEAEGHRVRGIVHAAGVVDDATLGHVTLQSIEAVLAPKAKVAQHLELLLPMHQLDFVIFYSSATGTLGAPGQAAYAAANAALDAIASGCRAQGLPAFSVAWGPWAGDGMAARAGQSAAARWSASGVEPLSVSEGIARLEAVLSQREPHVLAIKADWSKLSRVAADERLARLLSTRVPSSSASEPAVNGAELGVRTDWSKLPAEERNAQLKQFVADRVRHVLSMPSDAALDPDVPLADLGLDSLMVVELKNAIGRATGLELPAALMFERPTLATLCAFLQEKLGADDPQQPAAPTTPHAATNGAEAADGMQRFRKRRDLVLGRIAEAKERNIYHYEIPVRGLDGAWVHCGTNERKLMFSTYTYLGLLGHPRINRAAAQALEHYGTGTHGVRLAGGSLDLHQRLEMRIAEFFGREGAVTFTSGFTTNYATISTLVGPGDWVIGDQWNHASLVDGCNASGALFRVFKHNDVDDLARILAEAPASALKLVVADAIFSLDGDVLNLPPIVELCRKHGALLMVDEAHSLGVLGPRGRGIEDHYGMPGCVDVLMGTLSKTIPAVGGFITGKRELVDFLRFSARGYVFSAAMPPPTAAAALEAFDVMEDEGAERRARLMRNVSHFLDGLRRARFDTGLTSTAIIPVIVGSDENAILMTDYCQRRGLFVLPILPPAVPKGTARLRLNVTCAHSLDEIDHALAIIKAGAAAIFGHDSSPAARETNGSSGPALRPATFRAEALQEQ